MIEYPLSLKVNFILILCSKLYSGTKAVPIAGAAKSKRPATHAIATTVPTAASANTCIKLLLCD